MNEDEDKNEDKNGWSRRPAFTTAGFWTEKRWHLHGQPVHAGCAVEFEGWGDGSMPSLSRERKWFPATLEPRDSGRIVFAVVEVHGVYFEKVVADAKRQYTRPGVRWPLREVPS